MKRAKVGMIAIGALAVATVAFAQSKPDFSGTWTIDQEATQAAAPAGGGAAGTGGTGGQGRGGGMGMGPMMVKHMGDTLTVETTRGENKVTLTYKLDGTESKNTVAGRQGQTMEQVAVAKWSGNNIVITRKQQTPDGTTVDVTETWSLAGNTLTVETTGGRGAMKRIYKKTT